jgi:hypothetical protein
MVSMTANTPNIGLTTYNTTTDGSSLFYSYVETMSGSASDSNMSKIDAFAGIINGSMVGVSASLVSIDNLSSASYVMLSSSSSIQNGRVLFSGSATLVVQDSSASTVRIDVQATTPIVAAGSSLTHALSGVIAGTYNIPSIIIDSMGHVTSASSASITSGSDGWTLSDSTWNYISASAIGIPNASITLSMGDKLKYTVSGSVRYQYVISSSGSVAIVTGGSDYPVINNVISNNYYSHESSPVGFPQWFSLTAPTWTTSGTAFTNQPATNSAKFQIAGRVLSVSIRFTMNATSGGTGRFIATFTAGELPSFVIASAGSVFNYNTFLGGTSWTTTTQNVVSCSKYDGTALATNSEICALFINVVV